MNTPRVSRLSRVFSLLAGAAALVIAPAAMATTVQFLGWKVNVGGPRPTVDLRAPIDQTVQAGEFSLLVDGRAESSFCIELTQNISLPGTYHSYTLVGPNSSALGDRAFNDLQIGRLSRLYQNYLGLSRTGTAQSAAFQVAVWEITYDGKNSLGLGSGNFRLDQLGSAGTIAAGWLNGLDALSAGQWSFQALASPYRQDQLLARVPVPASAMLVGLGLAGMGLSRRRRPASAASAA